MPRAVLEVEVVPRLLSWREKNLRRSSSEREETLTWTVEIVATTRGDSWRIIVPRGIEVVAKAPIPPL